MESEETGWHLDKRVPLTMIVVFVLQTITVIYVGTTWKVEVEARLKQLEKSEERQQSQESRLVVVEQQLTFIAESVKRIESAVAGQK
jgi:hypothetical protein